MLPLPSFYPDAVLDMCDTINEEHRPETSGPAGMCRPGRLLTSTIEEIGSSLKRNPAYRLIKRTF